MIIKLFLIIFNSYFEVLKILDESHNIIINIDKTNMERR